MNLKFWRTVSLQVRIVSVVFHVLKFALSTESPNTGRNCISVALEESENTTYEQQSNHREREYRWASIPALSQKPKGTQRQGDGLIS